MKQMQQKKIIENSTEPEAKKQVENANEEITPKVQNEVVNDEAAKPIIFEF